MGHTSVYFSDFSLSSDWYANDANLVIVAVCYYGYSIGDVSNDFSESELFLTIFSISGSFSTV